MRVLVQRCKQASLVSPTERTLEIKKGLVLFVAFNEQDSIETLEWMVRRIVKLPIFDNDQKKKVFSVKDVYGSIVTISQATLYGDLKERNRYDIFDESLLGDQAVTLYNFFIRRLKKHVPVKAAKFGYDMDVQLVNDGPVSILLER